ncbi:hypothetical protein [Stackebrandtia nassauensis]|uniref:Uncharacterized protein n=1 Tax=Stackebrandtia nassauensis (strain DSM 44728 / CIP 108903 / NRRL B-16338 / NBRC 102104 / LLR-40K-21) TaxID=446470 RepID=D3Q4J8_STANL|nr:hypothetical protein [Stackebrandtia nassauensis]ADD40158.1 hypothetical protein Snas_0443 [Stackebrandtia nassauensis DSM 44728]
MNEKTDSESGARLRKRRKWLWWSIFLSVLVLLVGTATVVLGGYFTEKGKCPESIPSTGVKEPVGEANEKWLKLVDSGFTPFDKGPVKGAAEDLSFGYLLKNTSEYVLYNADIDVSFKDANGDDPTALLKKSDQRENASVLDSVNIPVIFPGQTVGMGSSIAIWTEHGEDPETGEPVDLEKIDYDKLTLDIDMASGQWWEPSNDKLDFTRVAAKSVDVVDSESSEHEYLDGREWLSADIEYLVESKACQDLKAYKPSTVVFDAENKIVGGDISGSKGDTGEGGTYRANSDDVRYEVTELLPEGGAVKVYPYARPTKPKLE